MPTECRRTCGTIGTTGHSPYQNKSKTKYKKFSYFHYVPKKLISKTYRLNATEDEINLCISISQVCGISFFERYCVF